MNKTLLLILVDFLLLTIISMMEANKKDPATANSPAESEQPESVVAMAMMEQDLLDTLQFSLQEQNDAKADLAAALSARESRIQDLTSTLTEAEQRERELQRARQELEATTQNLRSEADTLKDQSQSLKSEAERLAEEVASSKKQYATVTEKLEDTALAARQAEAQSRLLQEELKQKLADIAAKEKALAQASQELQQSQSRIQELDVKVKMGEQERSFLKESVSDLKSEVEAERTERNKAQDQAGVLAQGVTKLAESSQDLRKEFRSSIPINANQLFADYQRNQILTRFGSLKLQRNRYLEAIDQASTVLVTDGVQTYALLHIDSGPFSLKSNPSLIGALQVKLSHEGTTVSAKELRFLDADPRVVGVPLTPQEVERLVSKPYLTAVEPFKFAQAVLVNKQGDYYGEVEFKLDAETPGYVKMQSKIFSAIFGEFSPSTGDLVLSKTGELLGVMVNRRYCALVRDLGSKHSLGLGNDFTRDNFKELLKSLNDKVDTYPGALQ